MDVDVVEDTMMTITINKVVTFQRYFGETEKDLGIILEA